MVRNTRGITLVELLIVIVILGIIAAIAVPAVGNIVENAQRDAILADATQIRSSAQTAAASENWDVFDWDWEEDGDGQPNNGSAGVLSNVFENENVEVSDLEAAGYIDGVDAYIAWIYNGEWIVAVQSDDWTFVGNPIADDERDNVFAHGDDNDLESISVGALSTGSWPTDDGDFGDWLTTD